MKKKFGSFVALGFLVFLIYYTISNRSMLEPLLHVSAQSVVLIAIIKIVQMLVNGLFTKITMDAFNKHISHKESAYVALLSSLGNYFGPILGGLGVRAAYLKKKYDFALTHFVGTLYGYYLVTFFTSATLGLLSLGAIYLKQGAYSLLITFALVGVALSTGILFLIKVPKIQNLQNKKYVGKFYKRILQISEGWEILASNGKLFQKMLGLGFVMLSIGFVTSLIEFYALHLPFTIPGLLLYTTLGSMSLLISFTPGAIGIRESVYVFSAGVLSLSSNQILQLATIDRGIAISVLLVSYIYLQFLQKRKRQLHH